MKIKEGKYTEYIEIYRRKYIENVQEEKQEIQDWS